jgi:hypothetical protein
MHSNSLQYRAMVIATIDLFLLGMLCKDLCVVLTFVLLLLHLTLFFILELSVLKLTTVSFEKLCLIVISL